MIRSHPILTAFAAAMVLALAAGCGGGGGSSSPSQIPSSSNNNGNNQAPLSAQQQSDITNSTVHEIGNAVETGLGGGLSFQRSSQSLNPCITPSPNPPVIDPNGIPKNETYSFLNCMNLGWAQGETVNGQINIFDTSAGQSLSYTQTDTNLTLQGTDNGISYTEVRNGQRFPTLVNNVETVTRAMQVTRTTQAGTANISQNWQWTFTPAAGQTLQLLHKLPAGQFSSAAGTITHTMNGVVVTVNFQITTPLTFDPTCTTPPRITSGVVAFSRSGGSNSGGFTATFTGCGIPPIIQGSGPSPTPSASATPTASPTPTASATATASATPTASPSPTPSPTASATPSPTPTPTATASPTPSPTPTSTST